MCYIKNIILLLLKVFFPNLEDEKITELYKTLNDLAFNNVVPNKQGYSSSSMPYVLYCKDGIGIYPYFAIGEYVHICIIPIDDQYIGELASQGVEIYHIDDEF